MGYPAKFKLRTQTIRLKTIGAPPNANAAPSSSRSCNQTAEGQFVIFGLGRRDCSLSGLFLYPSRSCDFSWTDRWTVDGELERWRIEVLNKH